VIFNPKDPFVHPAEFYRSEVYVPQTVVDFFQADVLAGEGVRDADPAVQQGFGVFRLTGVLVITKGSALSRQESVGEEERHERVKPLNGIQLV